MEKVKTFSIIDMLIITVYLCRWLQPVLEGDGLLQRLREAGDSDDEDPAHHNASREEVGPTCLFWLY